ncbi:efflux RND transporter periplasmic adaptor subunit [Proteiniclasticum sp. BAD-10]|uniref:Efflux RND transporter periplasmic adaptor subunit n=1 Tax=Proteiniclasticum sediminis TaxID=2804028 RepID=A0A941CQ74_9CLOT|nr:efflux RND transporter periplasmic adaptor subunit [Proteiniclasticum sediminis]MBR0575768.1 efflux RND transporter periplasmic adaptor subunit [Proteiniclasticum sediminis]
MNGKNKLIAGVVFLALAGAIGYSIYNSRKVNPVTVNTAVLEKGEVSNLLLSTGKITSNQEKSWQGVNLQVKAVHVAVGQRVKAGDLLVEFDRSDLETAVKQAEIALENAKLNLEQTKSSIAAAKKTKSSLEAQVKTLNGKLAQSKARLEEALKDPLTPENIAIVATETQAIAGYESALTQIQQSLVSIPTVNTAQTKLLENTVASAQLAVDTAKNRLQSTPGTLTASFDGVVTEVNATENTIATMGVTLVTVKDDQNLVVSLNLGKFDAAKVKLGQEATVIYGASRFSGAVVFINPAASSGGSALGALGSVTTVGESSLGVKVSIVNPKDIILDFDADVEILLEKKADVLRIPVESILYKAKDKPYVFVVENGLLVEKDVTLGLISDSYLECLEGLAPGEKVVLNPQDTLKAGDQVIVND